MPLTIASRLSHQELYPVRSINDTKLDRMVPPSSEMVSRERLPSGRTNHPLANHPSRGADGHHTHPCNHGTCALQSIAPHHKGIDAKASHYLPRGASLSATARAKATHSSACAPGVSSCPNLTITTFCLGDT
jgi:hypothetical protein